MDLEARDLTRKLSCFDRTALAALRFVPGARKNGVSDRVLLAMRGSAWTIGGYGAGQLLRLVTQLVLARKLLGPSAFGLAALVMVFLSGLEMLSDLGLGLDVIQHPRGDDPRFINTAFLIQAGRGLTLFGLAAALAFPFAQFYHQPEVRWMIFVAAASIGLRGLASGSVWTMTRHVQLGKLTALNVGGDAAGLAVSIGWAMVSPTAWALVAGRVAGSAVYVIGSHLISEHPVSLAWDSIAARDVLTFGIGMFLSSASYFLGGESERLILGKFVTVSELGCYSLASNIAAMPSRAVQQLVGQVFFPMISRSVRESHETAVRHFTKPRLIFFGMSVLLGMGFIAYSNKLAAILLGPRYLMVGWMLQLLGFRAAQDVFAAPTVTLILACGKPKYLAMANIARLFLVTGGLLAGFSRYGLHGAIVVLAVVPAIVYLFVLWGIAYNLRLAFWVDIACFSAFLSLLALASVVHWPWT